VLLFVVVSCAPGTNTVSDPVSFRLLLPRWKIVEVTQGTSVHDVLELLKGREVISRGPTPLQWFSDQSGQQGQGSQIIIKFTTSGYLPTEKYLCAKIYFARFVFDPTGRLADLEQWSEKCGT
jgi:hypothetical protein